MGSISDLFAQIQEGLQKQSRASSQERQEQKKLPPPLEFQCSEIERKNEPLNDQYEDSEAGCITHASVIKELVSKRKRVSHHDPYEVSTEIDEQAGQSEERQPGVRCKPMKRKYLDEDCTTTDTYDSYMGLRFGNYKHPMEKDFDELVAGHHVSDQFQESEVEDARGNPMKRKDLDEDQTNTDTNFVLAFGNYQHQPTDKDVDDLVGFANRWIETTNGKRRRSA